MHRIGALAVSFFGPPGLGCPMTSCRAGLVGILRLPFALRCERAGFDS
jgi:hypothetical protein